jgi:hypothetical protein
MSVVQSGNNDKLKLAFDKSFASHETFAFRFAWLKKGIDKLSDDPGLFQKDSAIVTLGVGKNMVRSIRHWCLATRIVEEDDAARNRQLVPTTFGESLLHDDGWDRILRTMQAYGYCTGISPVIILVQLLGIGHSIVS